MESSCYNNQVTYVIIDIALVSTDSLLQKYQVYQTIKVHFRDSSIKVEQLTYTLTYIANQHVLHLEREH